MAAPIRDQLAELLRGAQGLKLHVEQLRRNADLYQ